MNKRILEIGPGDNPRHDIGGLKLQDGEEYFGLDYNPEEFKAPVWDKLRREYGDRVNLVVGSRDAIPFKKDCFDEVIMLGSQGQADQSWEEVDRVLQSGGVLKLGVLKWGAEAELAEWEPLLSRAGYKLVETKEHDYIATTNRDVDGERSDATEKTPERYMVYTFRKT